MIYYGTRLSENISRREPEGYLLCLNVPVARTGTQEYMPEELGIGYGDSPVDVFRPEEEVFSPETIASFEGMPVTNNHPPDGVTIENIRALQKGHAHNVRRGSGEESDLLLADLIITDEGLIEAILGGKREISCGYTYELHEENGQYIQRKIRGNHVAVVDAGRAGPRVSIRDHRGDLDDMFRPSLVFQNHIQKTERRKSNMKKSFLKKLSRMARDGDPDAVEMLAKAVEELVGDPGLEGEATVVIAAQTEPETAPAEAAGGETAGDEDIMAAILEKLDRLIGLLAPAEEEAAADEEGEEEDAEEENPSDLPEELAALVEQAVEAAREGENMLPEEVAAIVEEVVAEGEAEASSVLEPEEAEADCGGRSTADSLRAALKAIRPALVGMNDYDRNRVCADIARRVKFTVSDSKDYAALIGRRGKKTVGNVDLGRQIMARRNPNYKK